MPARRARGRASAWLPHQVSGTGDDADRRRNVSGRGPRRALSPPLASGAQPAFAKNDIADGHSTRSLPDIVRKEVWAHLLVYNLVRTLMAQAAAQTGMRPDMISFKGALQTFNAF